LRFARSIAGNRGARFRLSLTRWKNDWRENIGRLRRVPANRRLISEQRNNRQIADRTASAVNSEKRIMKSEK
jgi:hypothetical protein